MTWRPSGKVTLLVALLAPPLGLVLLWLRSGPGVGKKILGSLALLILSVVYLRQFFGLRIELDGSGMWPIFSFHKPESHFATIEHNRAASTAAPAAAAPAVEARSEPTENPPVKKIAPPAPPAYWTDFRGPNRDGRSDEMPILTEWPSGGLTRLWRQPCGGGYASFVVAEGKAYTIEQRRAQEVVAAYEVETGREVWTDSWDARFQESLGGEGPRATPTWHDGRLYALGAAGEFRCYEARSGKRLWSLNILTDNQAPNLQWAMSASPLIVDDKVIVLPGGPNGRSVVAYDRLTGMRIWGARDDQQAYTSPMLVTLAGRRQLLVVSARRVMGLAVEDGALLWEYPWTTQFDINSAQPIIVGANRFFISAAYDNGAAVVEISSGPGGFAARAVWSNRNMKNKFSSSVLHNGYIYGLDENILACIDVSTGERKWKGGRYGYGQLLLAGDRLIVTTEGGEVVMVKATPESHQELARFSAIDGKTWNVPAIAGGLLLVRNATEMACFRVGRASARAGL